MGSATAIPFKNPATATLFELVKSRRTFYDLEAESPIPDSTIDHVVKNAILHVPSSFNTQTTRAILLLKGEHRKLWDATIEIMEGLVAVGQISHEAFCTHTKPKLEGFRGAYGTVCVITPPKAELSLNRL
jgi:predicted oxidoreductase (fatty acid repression mutant protein)